jgi:hypothetical protein
MRSVILGSSLALNAALIGLAIWGYFGWISLKAEVLDAIDDRKVAVALTVAISEHAKNLEARLIEARHDLDLLRRR